MFEISTPEFLLVCIIGLLVLGPKRLPKVAAEIGKWVGRARRTASHLRRQLEREVELADLEKLEPPKPPPPPTPPVSTEEASLHGLASAPSDAPKSNGAADPHAPAVHDDGHRIGAGVDTPPPSAQSNEPSEPDRPEKTEP